MVMQATAESPTVMADYTTVANLDGANSGGFAPEAVISQLEKILTSTAFIRSKRLGRFLRFTVEQCLEGRQGALKEYLVGVEVFNKMETFDPRIDSIVRVEARRLRSKLEKYYQTDGCEDGIVIQFRKGSYVPAILSRDHLNAMTVLDGTGVRAGRKSIAVSRFSNLGLTPEYTYFCSGLTDDIISALTKLPSLRVMARMGSNGEEVKADYVVEGSVRKQNDRLRISAQLIDTTNSMYLWSETYERDLSDGFAVQDEIARAIVNALHKEFQTP